MALFRGSIGGTEFLVCADDQTHAAKLVWDDQNLSQIADELKENDLDGQLLLTQLRESAPGVFRYER